MRKTRSAPLGRFIIFRIFYPALATVIMLFNYGQHAQAYESMKLSIVSSSFADEVKDDQLIDKESLFLGYLGIAVATIVDIKTEKWSKSLPPLPIGQLKIEEQIRGNVPAKVHFVPLYYGTKHYEADSSDQKKWKGKTFAELVGKKWIVIANGINITDIYPYSEQTKNYIKTHMSSKGLGDNILMALFFIIIGILFIPLKFAVKLGTHTPVVLLVTQIVAYVFYEWGTPAYYNIRADLLLIIPAIFINGLLTMRFDLRQKQSSSITDK